MAVVTYTDSDGVEHWADEHSKAYEKHLKSEQLADSSEEAKVEPQAKVETKVEPAVRPAEVKPATEVKVAEPKRA